MKNLNKVVVPALALVALISLTGCDSQALDWLKQSAGVEALNTVWTSITDFISGLLVK